jgi:hypothetical protein
MKTGITIAFIILGLFVVSAIKAEHERRKLIEEKGLINKDKSALPILYFLGLVVVYIIYMITFN